MHLANIVWQEADTSSDLSPDSWTRPIRHLHRPFCKRFSIQLKNTANVNLYQGKLQWNRKLSVNEVRFARTTAWAAGATGSFVCATHHSVVQLSRHYPEAWFDNTCKLSGNEKVTANDSGNSSQRNAVKSHKLYALRAYQMLMKAWSKILS